MLRERERERETDEVHDRSCDIDIVLLLLREILHENDGCGLRVVLMSPYSLSLGVRFFHFCTHQLREHTNPFSGACQQHFKLV